MSADLTPDLTHMHRLQAAHSGNQSLLPGSGGVTPKSYSYHTVNSTILIHTDRLSNACAEFAPVSENSWVSARACFARGRVREREKGSCIRTRRSYFCKLRVRLQWHDHRVCGSIVRTRGGARAPNSPPRSSPPPPLQKRMCA